MYYRTIQIYYIILAKRTQVFNRRPTEKGDAGVEEHLHEIGDGMAFFYHPDNQRLVSERLKKYAEMKFAEV